MLAIPLEFSILASGETAGSNVSCRKFLGPLENLLCVTWGGGWGAGTKWSPFSRHARCHPKWSGLRTSPGYLETPGGSHSPPLWLVPRGQLATKKGTWWGWGGGSHHDWLVLVTPAPGLEGILLFHSWSPWCHSNGTQFKTALLTSIVVFARHGVNGSLGKY